MAVEEKPEEKKAEEGDAEMKVDGAAEEKKDGEEEKKDAAAVSSTKKPRKTPEPSTTTLSNLSRVTPAQLAYISFPSSTSRFQPIRPVNSGVLPSSAPSAKSSVGGVGAGGGILLVRDTKPEEEVELLELEVLKAIDVSGAGVAPAAVEGAAAAASGAGDDFETAPIAEVPPPFEYTEWD